MPKVPNTRSRVFKPKRLTARISYKLAGGPKTLSSAGYEDFVGKQTTVSEGHHWPPPKGGLSDQGGPFSTVKSYVETGSCDKQVSMQQPPSVGGFQYFYTGNCIPSYPITSGGSIFPPSAASSDAALNTLGASAISRCEPTNPVANVSTFLGELYKDGLPSLIGHRSWQSKVDSARKKAADEYLNVQFGWAPMISDIEKFAYAIKHADAVLAQYERDSGKVVRRRYNFPQTRTSSEEILNTSTRAHTCGASSSAFNSGSTGVLVRVKETTRRQWFSGAFTYYLPSDYDSRKGLARLAQDAEKLYGISLTPDVLWNLAPWSWAVDWFSNTGDIIHNLTKFGSGGLVMPYGYMMEHTINKYTYALSTSGLIDRSAGLGPFTLVTESKKRVKANPFGFGLNWDSLSLFQKSIAAALGLSRIGR